MACLSVRLSFCLSVVFVCGVALCMRASVSVSLPLCVVSLSVLCAVCCISVSLPLSFSSLARLSVLLRKCLCLCAICSACLGPCFSFSHVGSSLSLCVCSQRFVLMFPEAIVICKPRPNGEYTIKHLCSLDSLFLHTMLHDQACFRLTFADNNKVRNRILLCVCTCLCL